ncbi:cation diffusion facilitator family transporter [Rhodoplanes azumiensis]|uniref:Cation diffusion facilitator family transporter n=1 Tax=Rhodoplanes azumiensis TaxID=1897628 RepID=A0ABW5AGA4_9BRAD
MADKQDHGHVHGVVSSPVDASAVFKWAVGLNAGYVIVEAIAGFSIGSLALLADAAHNLTDVGGLLIAWWATVAATRPPTEEYTYGLGRSTIMAALTNGVAILVGAGAVIWEAVQRFSDPVAVPAGAVIIVALLGIAINGGTALMFRAGRKSDLNSEGAFLHMAADAAVSLGVVASAALMLFTGWSWLDPITAILVSMVIVWAAYGLLKASLSVALDAVPASVDHAALKVWMEGLDGVTEVHDLHVWALSTTSNALTAHLVIPSGHPGDAFLDHVAEELREHFGIGHAVFQIELGDGPACRFAPANVP